MNNNWPNDVDGDVFRRLKDHGFDFSPEHTVDFNVDFDDWPPSGDALERLKSVYHTLEVVEPNEKDRGYVLILIRTHLSYDFVMEVKRSITDSMKEYGGSCNSWGVMQE